MELSFKVKYILWFLWHSSLYIVPLLIFVKGLLLHRDVLPNRSFCRNDTFSTCFASTKNFYSCQHLYNLSDDGQYCVPSDHKVILLVIDALRFDFVEYQSGIHNPAPYHNKLKSIADLLATRLEHTRLFRFMADPPTTTMQRIKGLTTGSLPTFIDIGSNFASTEIDEDNIIDTMIRNGKNAVLLGDDTWTKLYPARFIRSFPFDSFNVWDLDTVDKGVEKHLLSEIGKTDWHLIIAHFLGVDHCGHRYGPNHAEMERKLLEMDSVIRDVVNEIQTRDDIILFVIGDHGMTATGDHGGGTENEITTALFAYSPVHPFFDDNQGTIQSVSQVDLVPTLASILGVPIPFSNTGQIALGCIPRTILGSVASTAFILWQNIKQITTYVKEYSSENTQFENARKDQILSKYLKLKDRWFHIESMNAFQEFVVEYKVYMRSILDMCREVWIQFNFSLICCGIIFMAVTAMLNVIVANETKAEIPMDIDVVFYSGGIFLISWLLLPLHMALIVYETISIIHLVCWSYKKLPNMWKTMNITLFHHVLSHLCLAGALFSNSFILEEPSVVLFFIATCLWLSYIWNGKNITVRNFVVSSIAYRIGFFAVKCRDDQKICDKMLLENNYNTKYPFVAAIMFFFLTRINKRTTRFLILISRGCMIFLVVFWVKQSIVGNVLTSYTLVDSIPGLIFAICIVTFGILIHDPVVDAEVVDISDRTYLASSNISLIVCIVSAVLLDSTVSISSISMVVCLQNMGDFLNSITHGTDSNKDILWSPLILWSMSALYWFYATGHYASFSAIQWNAAFLFQKDIGNSMLLPGTLVVMNTFASYIVHGLLLSVLLTKSKCSLHSKNANLLCSMVVYMKYVTIFATRLLAMMMACALHSRHLMMWQIFAPKFIFEAIAFLVTIVSSLIGLLIAYNIHK